MNEDDRSNFLRHLTALSPKEEKVTAILLTCMDFRYPQAIVDYMRDEGLAGDYDHVILAGASLGAVLDSGEHIKLHWQRTFFDHVDIAIYLHAITTVYILDHRDCGAYRVFRGLPRPVPEDVEREAHEREMRKLKGEIESRYANVSVRCGLLEELKEEKFTVN